MRHKHNPGLFIVYVTEAPWFIKVERREEFGGSSQGLVVIQSVPQSRKCFV